MGRLANLAARVDRVRPVLILVLLLTLPLVFFTQLHKAHGLLFRGIVPLVGFAAVALTSTSRSFLQRYVGEAPPESLGWIRMLTCGILLTSTLWEDLASTALLPRELRHPPGIMQVFNGVPLGFDRFLASPEALTAFKWLTASFLFLGMVGWRTRITVPLAAFCYLVVGGILRTYSQFFHTGLLPLYLMGILMWTPCGDAWSVDRLLRRYRGNGIPVAAGRSSTYAWSRYACWVTITLTYEAAGLSKLREGGLFWWDATNIRAKLYAGTLNPMPFDWGLSLRLAGAPDALFSMAGIFVLLVELLFAAVLFSSVARRIVPVAAMVMHIGMWVLQNVLFFDSILLQFAFFDIPGYLRKVQRARMRSEGRGGPTDSLESPQEGRSGVILSGAAAFRNGLYALGVSALIIASMTIWLNRIEFYPLSAWQMYAYYSNTVAYIKVLARDETGATSRAYLERAVPAITDLRFLPAIQSCFSPREVRVCEAFLRAIGSVMNRRSTPRHRMTAFIVQKWSWDHRAHPSDPEHGKPISMLVFTDLEVPPPVVRGSGR